MVLIVLVGTVASAAPAIEDFIRSPDYLQASISPDGRYLAQIVNRREDGMRILSVTDLSAESPEVVGLLAQRIMRPVSMRWANSERLLVTIDVPPNTRGVERELIQNPDLEMDKYYVLQRMISMDPDASNTVVLLKGQRTLRRNETLSEVSHFLPDDPQHIQMIVIDGAGRGRLLKVNVYTGDSEIVTTGSTNTFAFLSTESGEPRYRLDYPPMKDAIIVYELREDMEWEKAARLNLRDEDRSGSLNRDLVGLLDDELVYLEENRESGLTELVSTNPTTLEKTVIASVPDQDVYSALLDGRTDSVIGYGVEGDVIRNHFFSDSAQARYDRLTEVVGEWQFQIDSTTDDDSKMVFSVRGPNNPASFYLHDSRSGENTFLGDRSLDLNQETLSPATKIKYPARDGQSIPGYVLFPQSWKLGQKLPLVVMPHGGPHSRDRLEYDAFAQFVSTRGYIVMQPNFRGSTGFGKPFEVAGHKQWGQLMQDDVEDGIHWMIDKGYANPEKICMVGGSYGGYAALMGAIRFPDLLQCSVSIAGVTHLPDLVAHQESRIDSEEDIRAWVYERIGHPVQDEEMLKAQSPALLAEQVGVPILLIAGTQDEVVPYKQARKMRSALRKAKKPVEYVGIPNTGHNVFYYREDTEKIFEEVGAFLAEHLN